MSSARKYRSKVVEELRQEALPQLKELISKRMSLAAKIDDALQEKGLTNQEFAFMMGKKPSEISRWLSGIHNFTTETLWEIERILNIQLLTSSYPKPDALKEKEELKAFIVNEVEKALDRYLSSHNAIIN